MDGMVVLATGGFQSNLQMVQEFWPDNLRFPDRLLLSSGINALGSGHALAQEVGAMVSYGAQITPQEQEILVKYAAQNFGRR